MMEADLLARISVNWQICGGDTYRFPACAQDLDVGSSPDAILEAYPHLEREDIDACAITIKHSSKHTGIPRFSYEQVAA